MSSRISTHYHSIICQDIILAHQLNNVMQLPRIKKCTLNCPSKIAAQIALESVTGQKPTQARKSTSSLKLRKNSSYAVNLRGRSLFNFLDHFISILSPCIYSDNRHAKKSPIKKYNFSISRFTDFSLLQWHFLALSNQGGVNGEFFFLFPGTCSLEKKRNISFFSAFQFPCDINQVSS